MGEGGGACHRRPRNPTPTRDIIFPPAFNGSLNNHILYGYAMACSAHHTRRTSSCMVRGPIGMEIACLVGAEDHSHHTDRHNLRSGPFTTMPAMGCMCVRARVPSMKGTGPAGDSFNGCGTCPPCSLASPGRIRADCPER